MKKMLKLISIIPFVVLVSACSKNNGNIKNVDDKKTDNVELNKKTRKNIKKAYSNSNIYCPEFYQDDNSNIYNITCYGVFGKTAVLASISDEELTKTHIEHWAMDKTFVYTENVNVYLYDDENLTITDITDAFYKELISYEDLKQAYSVYEKIHYNSDNDHFLSEITDADDPSTAKVELDEFVDYRIRKTLWDRFFDYKKYKAKQEDFLLYVYGRSSYTSYGIYGDYVVLSSSTGLGDMVIAVWYTYYFDDISFGFNAGTSMFVYNYKTNELIDLLDETSKQEHFTLKEGYISYEDMTKVYDVYTKIFNERRY